jgi:hypothetical protein
LHYDPKHPNASNRITTPRLSFGFHCIASHCIWPHLASHRIRIDQDDLPLPRTVIQYEPTIITTAKQKQSLDRQIDIDL